MAWFSHLPQHNQIDVLKKLDYIEFIRFKQCSRETMEIGDGFKHKLPLEGDYATIDEDKLNLEITCNDERNLESAFDEPIRLMLGRVFVQSTTSNGMEIEEIVRRSGLTSTELYVVKDMGNLDSAAIDRLLRATKLVASYYPSSELMQLEELKNLDAVSFKYGEVQDSDFLRLKTTKTCIHEGGLSQLAVNKFFKQWNEGKRQIEELMIFPLEAYDEILETLDISLIWSADPAIETPYGHVRFDSREEDDEELLEVFMVKREEDGRRILVGFSKWEKITMTAMEIEEDEDIEEWIRQSYE